MTLPLSVSKLPTTEDEGLQAQLARLDVADRVAREMVIQCPIPVMSKDWTRMEKTIRELGGGKYVKREWAYFIGLCVGLRLARAVDAPLPSWLPAFHSLTSERQAMMAAVIKTTAEAQQEREEAAEVGSAG